MYNVHGQPILDSHHTMRVRISLSVPSIYLPSYLTDPRSGLHTISDENAVKIFHSWLLFPFLTMPWWSDFAPFFYHKTSTLVNVKMLLVCSSDLGKTDNWL